MTISDGKINLA